MSRLSQVVGGALLFVSAVSLAQGGPPPSAPPPPPAAEAQQPPPPPPPPGEGEGRSDAPARDEGPVVDPGMRVRFGASAGMGTFFPGPMVNFGLEGRVGWQFTNILGVYFVIGRNSGLWFGGTVVAGSGGGGVSMNVGFVGYTHFGFEAEAIFANRFFIAAGPQIAAGGWGFVGQSAMGGSGGASVTQEAGVVDGWLPALGTKIGIGFGHPNPTTGRRTGFSIMLSTMFVLGSGGIRAAQNASGGMSGASVYQGVAPYGGLGIAPLLLFGFESR